MDNGSISGGDLVRLVGFMGISVGVAWALQILGFGDATAFGRFLWVMAAASVAGAGAGLVMASGTLRDGEGAPAKA